MLKKLIRKLWSREVVAYVIAGVLTTAINIVVFQFLRSVFHMDTLWANGIAWVVSVLFAFVVNDRYVFIQEKMGLFKEMEKMGRFFLARLFSFFVDQAGMWLLVDYLGVHDMASKIGMNVIVIIMNYILSKLFIFHAAS